MPLKSPSEVRGVPGNIRPDTPWPDRGAAVGGRRCPHGNAEPTVPGRAAAGRRGAGAAERLGGGGLLAGAGAPRAGPRGPGRRLRAGAAVAAGLAAGDVRLRRSALALGAT